MNVKGLMRKVVLGASLLSVGGLASKVEAEPILSVSSQNAVMGIGGRYNVDVRVHSDEPFWGVEWVLEGDPHLQVSEGTLPDVLNDAFEGYGLLPGFNMVEGPGQASVRAANIFDNGLGYGPGSSFGGIVGKYIVTPTGDSIGVGRLYLGDVGIYSREGEVYTDSIPLEITCTGFGDANLDGMVTSVDVGELSRHYRHSGGWEQGDFSGDGRVNLLDLTLLARNYGWGVDKSGQAFYALQDPLKVMEDIQNGGTVYDFATNSYVNFKGTYPVPEAGTGALMALGAGSLAFLRRVRRKDERKVL